MNKEERVITNSAEETIALGKKIGESLVGGEVICLSGNLGAGKTHLVKGIALGLGVVQTISSPTFVLMRNYSARDNLSLYHLDLYRITSAVQLADIDFDDLLKDKKNIIVIEWAENAQEAMPPDKISVKISSLSDNQREIIITRKD